MKKFLKIFGIVLGVIILLLFLTPFIFEGQLKKLVINTINKRLNAEVAFADMDLSLLKSFPEATLSIEDFTLINQEPFEGDTLAKGEEVVLKMSIKELFKGSSEPVKIDAIEIDRALVDLKIDSLGNENYDIVKPDTSSTAGSSSAGFSFDVDHYEINNSVLRYFDQPGGIELLVQNLDHSGTGDFSAVTSTLSTKSSADVSLNLDGTNYLDQNEVSLEADFKMDLDKMKFSFLENEALINQLPLTFDGYVQVNETNNEVDIRFKTPSSSFKNFLAVIPAAYSKNIEEVETRGDFVVRGEIQGIVDELHIPKMNISISSDNAYFKYPDLPKAVEDIDISAVVINETGISEDTYIEIDTLNFRIDEDNFRANGILKNLTGNTHVELALQGSINLANLEKAYPLELDQDLNGLVYADLVTRFTTDDLEQERYQNVYSEGTARIEDFSYSSPEIPNEIELSTAVLNFNPGVVSLEKAVLTTGETDLGLTGEIHNLMGFLFTDQQLKGNFKARSERFVVNDFMVQENPDAEVAEDETEQPEEAIRIPSFLDAELDFAAENVLYDNLVLKNTSGKLLIANETATLSDVTSDIFGGNILLNGSVVTKDADPKFNMQLNLQSIELGDAFRDMELLQNIAPIAEALRGVINTKIELRGDLKNDLTPQLETIAGQALAEILGANIEPSMTPLLSQIDKSLTFIDLEKLNLKGLKTQLTFNDGQVAVAPFNFDIEGIKGEASGVHNFDMSMDYKVALKVPARYLGSEVGELLSKLTEQQQDSMTVILPIGISGEFQNPVINLNLDQAVANLTQRIIENQKENLKEKGKNILTDILTDNLPGQPADTLAKTPDSVQKKDPVREAAKDILGGILSQRKKKKDSLNQN